MTTLEIENDEKVWLTVPQFIVDNEFFSSINKLLDQTHHQIIPSKCIIVQHGW